MSDMETVTGKIWGSLGATGVFAFAVACLTIAQVQAAPGPSVKLQKTAPPQIELSPFAGRGPASVSGLGGSNTVLGRLLKSEPVWYRNTAALSQGFPITSPEPNGALGGSRAPAHPSDGMWRSYDSPGLGR